MCITKQELEIINKIKTTYSDMISDVEYKDNIIKLSLIDYTWQDELAYLLKLNFADINKEIEIIIN